jgi:alpha-L-rhamnosidase
MAPSIESILKRFERFIDETGLVVFSAKDEWDFVDWADHLHHADKRRKAGGDPSGLLSLNHVYALDRAAKIMRFLGDETKAKVYEARSKRIRNAVYAQCWDEDKGVLANGPEKKFYSEHANLLGILTDAIPPAQQKAVMEKILAGTPEMTKATIYFRFYYNRALVKTGMADRYLDTLDIWRDQLKLNLSTWAEKPEPARSDCHAWGSSPNYEFLATVAGITPAAPGFSKVRIAPALGALESVEARMPHPKGMIEVTLRKKGAAGIAAQITLPDGLTGSFEWGGKIIPLNSSEQFIEVK